MATAQFIQDGKSIDYTPAAAVAAGDVVVQGDLVGVAKLDIAAGQKGALATVGIFDIDKAAGAGTGIAAGTKVYWDAGNSVATADDNAGANKYLGKTIAAAADDDAVARVRLDK